MTEERKRGFVSRIIWVTVFGIAASLTISSVAPPAAATVRWSGPGWYVNLGARALYAGPFPNKPACETGKRSMQPAYLRCDYQGQDPFKDVPDDWNKLMMGK
jgi:hypothetical protein